MRGTAFYDEYIEQINELLEPYDVDFYDFNLCKKEFFFDDTCFMDDHHLNKKGAEKFSVIFSQFFTGEIDKEELFYQSINEKENSIQ